MTGKKALSLLAKQQKFDRLKWKVAAIRRDEYQDSVVNLQNQRYVKFTLTLPTTYVISGMGSGKSTELVKILNLPEYRKPEARIVCLSFRISFTTEFSKKYNLVSYQDIQGPIDFADTPKIIVQVDSLFRIKE